MARTFSSLSLSAKDHVEFHISPEWTKPHRQQLRQALVDQVRQDHRASAQEIAQALDLKQRPQFQSVHTSISHCQACGVFSLSPTAIHGIDVEDFERITEATVARISTSLDLQNAPSPQALWVAKEAIFKCLHHAGHAVDLLSEIQGLQFHQKNLNSWSFTLNHPQSLRGLVWRNENLILGLAYIFP